MSEAASAAAAAPADRVDEDRPFDVEAAADAIERLLGADGARPGEAQPAAAASGTAAAAGDGRADEPRLMLRFGAAEREVPLAALAALYEALRPDEAAATPPPASAEAPGPAPADAAPQTPPEPDPVAALRRQLDAFAGIDWARMAAEDPALHARARAAYEALAARLAAVEAEAARQAAASRQAAQAAALVQARHLEAERKALAEAVPEFADPRSARREAAALVAYLAKAGYEPAEIDALSDHRHVVLARKAMLYDRLMQDRARVAEAVKALPPVQTPGTAPERRAGGGEGRGALMQRLKRSGRVEDAARLIEELI